MVGNQKIRQVELATEIIRLLQGKGVKKMDTKLSNLVLKVSTELADECNRDRVYADAPMSSSQWLLSDDVGLSSKYMHLVITGLCSEKNGFLPLDVSDLGRCIRMVESCELRGSIDKMMGCSVEWDKIITNWERLVGYYKNKDGTRIFKFLNDL